MRVLSVRKAAQVLTSIGLVVGVSVASSTVASATGPAGVGTAGRVGSSVTPQLVVRGSAQALPGNIVQLTDGLGQAGAAWSAQPVSALGGFSAAFRFRILPDPGNCCADGFTFVIQNDPRPPNRPDATPFVSNRSVRTLSCV